MMMMIMTAPTMVFVNKWTVDKRFPHVAIHGFQEKKKSPRMKG